MSLPWGVNDEVDPNHAEAVITFMSDLADQTFELQSGNTIQVLKADVKERKGKYVLILRYVVTIQA